MLFYIILHHNIPILEWILARLSKYEIYSMGTGYSNSSHISMFEEFLKLFPSSIVY